MVTAPAAPAGGTTARRRRWTGSWARCPAGRLRRPRRRQRARWAGPAGKGQLAARPACTACWASCTALHAQSCCDWVQPRGSTCPRPRQQCLAWPSPGSTCCRRRLRPPARRPPPCCLQRRRRRSRQQQQRLRQQDGQGGRQKRACRMCPVQLTWRKWTSQGPPPAAASKSCRQALPPAPSSRPPHLPTKQRHLSSCPAPWRGRQMCRQRLRARHLRVAARLAPRLVRWRPPRCSASLCGPRPAATQVSAQEPANPHTVCCAAHRGPRLLCRASMPSALLLNQHRHRQMRPRRLPCLPRRLPKLQPPQRQHPPVLAAAHPQRRPERRRRARAGAACGAALHTDSRAGGHADC